MREFSYYVAIALILVLSLSYHNLSAQVNSNKVGIEGEKIDGEYIGGVMLGRRSFTPVFSQPVITGDIIVSTKTELLEALVNAKRGQTIYIPGNVVIDLTGENKIRIPHGITLASDRGYKKSKGALLYSELHGTSPLIRLLGNNVKITGLRFSGPDQGVYYNITEKTQSTNKIDLKKLKAEKGDYHLKMDALPRTTGMTIEGANAEVYNCEFYGWTMAAISVTSNGKNAVVHHNYIHHNQHFGLGYGVLLYKATALIKANLFDFNNHSVTGTGHVGTGFEVVNNIFKENHIRAWAVDMHGGADRKDGTDIAGDSFIVRNNDFYLQFGRPGINIRGVPQQESDISNNKFVYLTKNKNIRSYEQRRRALGLAVKVDKTAKNDKATAIRTKGGRSLVHGNEVIDNK